MGIFNRKQELQDLEDRVRKHTELIMLNLVQQIRGILLASKISPEDFYKAFTDGKAQDEFYIQLKAIEIKNNPNESQGSQTPSPQAPSDGQNPAIPGPNDVSPNTNPSPNKNFN